MAAHDAKTTTDHDEIRRWAEERGGKTDTVRGTGEGEEAGVPRIAFTDNEDLQAIDRDEFFDKFEEANLAFLYQDNTADGKPSRFFKFVEREEWVQAWPLPTRAMLHSTGFRVREHIADETCLRESAPDGPLGRQSLESQPRHLKMPSGISTLKAIAPSAIA